MEYVTDKKLRELANELVETFYPYAESRFDSDDRKELVDDLIPILRRYIVVAQAEANGRQATDGKWDGLKNLAHRT